MAVTVDDVRALALTLPRTTEHLIRDHVKFRIGRIVYLAFSRDESLLGFAFPKQERDALIASEPTKFMRPPTGDLRDNWVLVRLSELDLEEMRPGHRSVDDVRTQESCVRAPGAPSSLSSPTRRHCAA